MRRFVAHAAHGMAMAHSEDLCSGAGGPAVGQPDVENRLQCPGCTRWWAFEDRELRERNGIAALVLQYIPAGAARTALLAAIANKVDG